MAIVVMVDGGANLSKAMLKKYEIYMLPYNLLFSNGDVYRDIKSNKELINLIETYKEVPKVDQLCKEEIESCFRKCIDRGDDILYIGASSYLTSSFKDVLEASSKFNGSNIGIVDSLNIGSGEAILALYARYYINKGYGIKQTLKYLENIKLLIRSCYMVGNSKYLYRDYRCRNICNRCYDLCYKVPVLEVNKGKLVMTLEAKESNLALQVLKNVLIDNKNNMNKEFLIISYSGDKRSALKLKEYVNKYLNINNVEIIELNAAIFTNIGNNSLSLAFLNNEV